MNTVAHIRKSILGVNQAALAAIAGATQATVSRWESGDSSPDLGHLSAIREEVIRRGLDWCDSWFFESPVEGEGKTSVVAQTAGEVAA